ncbi:phage tail tube protein [Xanthobacter aminoxidans]|uniref:phage tail tube protein n=1 Tax=Xanthobacter aminoxidans TaxID=186280 RepID=UPI00372C9E46
MARAVGARSQFAAAFETTYGTAPGSGFLKLPFVSTTLSSEQGLIESDLLGLGRDPADPIRDVINADGDVVVPVDLRNFGNWLKLLLGAPTSAGAAGAYTHTFGSGGWTLPSLSAEIGTPEVPSYAMVSGIRANTMAIQIQRSGAASATIGCIAQGEALATSSAAGTPTEATLDRFNQFQAAVKKDGVALGNVTAASLSYSNNLDRVETIRNDGKIDGADPGMATLTGSLDVRFADTTLLDAATGFTSMELEFSWTISSTKKLVLTAHKVFLPKPRRSISGPGGIQASFAWQAAKGASRMLTAVLSNDVATY